MTKKQIKVDSNHKFDFCKHKICLSHFKMPEYRGLYVESDSRARTHIWYSHLFPRGNIMSSLCSKSCASKSKTKSNSKSVADGRTM